MDFLLVFILVIFFFLTGSLYQYPGLLHSCPTGFTVNLSGFGFTICWILFNLGIYSVKRIGVVQVRCLDKACRIVFGFLPLCILGIIIEHNHQPSHRRFASTCLPYP